MFGAFTLIINRRRFTAPDMGAVADLGDDYVNIGLCAACDDEGTRDRPALDMRTDRARDCHLIVLVDPAFDHGRDVITPAAAVENAVVASPLSHVIALAIFGQFRRNRQCGLCLAKP